MFREADADALHLKYAHENGCPWNCWTCKQAAENGHLDCLKYAHENGCPWNEYTCKHAAEKEHLECSAKRTQMQSI